MSLPFKKVLIDLEDELNDLNSGDDESLGEFGKIQLKEEFSFGKKANLHVVEDDLSSIDEEDVLSIVRSKHSGLFYKVTNHFNLMALTGHFSQWLSESKKIFSFKSFINEEEAFKVILALAAFYEHKENSKILIICDFEYFDKFFQKELSSKVYGDSKVNIYHLGASLSFINIHDLPDSSGIDEFEDILDEFELDFDMSFVLFPKEIHKNEISDYFKALMFKCSNVNYILNSQGTGVKDIQHVRQFFEGNGVEEGGVIIGEDHE